MQNYQEDNINAYLNGIGKFPLLSKAQEISLATRIAAGIEAETEMEKIDNGEIDADTREIRRLNRIITDGESAKNKFIESNLRLVVNIARHYNNNTHGLALLDLIQEGNFGLIKAVEKFDYTKGYKFSTYATWWIKQSIQRGINDKARTIRIPEDVIKDYSKILRAEYPYVNEGIEPDEEAIAKEMGITVERLAEIRTYFQGTCSLDAELGEEGDENKSSIANFVEDRSIMNPEDSIEATSLTQQIDRVLDTLNERSRQIVKLRFGLIDERQWTLEELGKEFNITRERVRQIEGKAIEKLREAEEVELLREFL